MTTNQSSLQSLTAASDQARSRSWVRTALVEAGLVLAGTAAIALIGQVSLPLPFTPVPVTLGTLAVIVVLLAGAMAIIRQANHNRVDFSNVNDASEVVVAKRDPELGREPRTLEEVRSEIVNGATDQERAQRMTTGSMA